MAFSFGDGFDCYAAVADAANGYWDSGVSLGNFLLVAGRFAGSQALSLSATGNPTLVKSSGQNDAVHHLVVAFQQTATTASSVLGSYLQLSDGATPQCTVVFNRNGSILLTTGSAAGATLATYASAFTVVNTWYAFEIEIVINNTTGRMRVRKNGNTSDDYDSGAVLNTRGGTANNYANRLQVGMNTLVLSQYFDDLFWRSDASSVAWMGDIRCYTRMPASDASVQFSRSTGATNFSCVDEAQQNTTTDYVFDSTAGHADFYGVAAIASTPVSTIAVTTRGYMQKSDAGSRTAAVQLKSGAAAAVASPTLTLTTSGWLWAWRTDTTDPATGAAWTAAAVNAAQVGPTTVT